MVANEQDDPARQTAPNEPASGPGSRWDAIPLAATVLIRLLCLPDFLGSPFLAPLGGDRGLYQQAACAVYQGNGLTEVFSFLPLYPYLLGWFYRIIGGPSLGAVAVLQAFLDGLTALLIAGLARRRYGLRAGLLAGLGYALFGLAAAYSLTTMPVSLGLFWTALTATGCDLWQSRWNLGRASLLGLLLGIGGQILGAFWLMLFPCSLWITLAATGTRRRRLSLGLLALLCGMAALLPTLAHNVKRGQWTPITTHGGLNFYMGNNPSCAGYGTAIPGLRLSAEEMTRDSTALASQLSGRNLSAAAADRYWKQQAWLFWRQTPAQALRLLCKKCHRLVSVRDFDDIGVLRLLVESVRTLPWTFVGFGLVWLCACAGYGLRPCRQINPGWWIMAGGFVSGMLLTFVTARYRLPLAVLLLPAAGATVAGAWTALMKYRWSAAGIVWRNKRSGVKLRWLAGLAGIGLSLAPHSLPDTTFVDNYNRANHWYQAGDAGKTMTYALQAVNQRRDSPEAWFLLGNAWMLQTNYAAALDAYGRVLKFQPDRTDALFNAGRALENLGDAAGAQIIFEQIVELDPRHAKAWFSLAILYRRTNQTTRSRDALAEAAGLVGWDHPDIRGELRIESRLPADQRP